MSQLTAMQLLQLRNGQALAAIDEHIAELGPQLEERNGKASITVKFAFAAKDGVVECTPTVSRTDLPAPPLAVAMLYATNEGFSRRDPNQREMDLVGRKAEEQ